MGEREVKEEQFAEELCKCVLSAPRPKARDKRGTCESLRTPESPRLANHLFFPHWEVADKCKEDGELFPSSASPSLLHLALRAAVALARVLRSPRTRSWLGVAVKCCSIPGPFGSASSAVLHLRENISFLVLLEPHAFPCSHLFPIALLSLRRYRRFRFLSKVHLPQCCYIRPKLAAIARQCSCISKIRNPISSNTMQKELENGERIEAKVGRKDCKERKRSYCLPLGRHDYYLICCIVALEQDKRAW